MDRPLSTGLPATGDRIADKYDVVRVVGEGGMGVVYEVMHTRLQQRAAIKMLQPRVQAMPEVAARFEREARAACRLRSRHAVRITDVDHDEGGRAYMVMEFLEGHDLAQELHTRGKLPFAEAVDVVMQACVAMSEAHASGVVHRDLKPSNLFLVEEGGERIVKVLDFGISKLTTDGEAAVTSTFATMGTPLYMSPEQIRSTKNVDGRTDIWSLGVILFEAIAGERPFQGTTTAAAAAIVADEPPLLRSFAPDVPEGLEAVVSKALAKKAEGRFPDVRAFAEALAAFGTNGDAMRAIEASGAGTTGGSIRPPAKRQSSTPSFVHATTLAQTTPPPVPGSSSSPLVSRPAPLASAPKSAARSAAPPPPSTEAAWATQRTSSGRAGQATRVAVGLALAAVAVVAVLKLRSATTATPPPLPSAAATVAPAPPPPPDPSTTPTPSSTSTSTPTPTPTPTSASPTPRHAPQPKPHAPPTHPVSSPAPPAQSSAAPAATNPLHL